MISKKTTAPSLVLASSGLGLLMGFPFTCLEIILRPGAYNTGGNILYSFQLYCSLGLLLGLGCSVAWRVASRFARGVSIPAEKPILSGLVYPSLVFNYLILGYYINFYWLPPITHPGTLGFNAVFTLVHFALAIALTLYLLKRAPVGLGRPFSPRARNLLFGISGVLFAAAVLPFAARIIFKQPFDPGDPGQTRAALGPRSEGAPFGDGDSPVFLILIDTLRADHLSCYDYSRPTSPRLDRLAAEGTLFENAYASSSWTVPSIATLFSGLYPSAHNTQSELDVLPGEIHTLSECFSAIGYETAGFLANPLIHPDYGFCQGMQTFYPPGRPAWFFQKRTALENIVRPAYFDQVFPGRKILDHAEDWIARRTGNRMFAYLHFMEPHDPYSPPPEWQKRFDPDFPEEPVSMPPAKRGMNGPAIPERQRVNMVAQYDGEIAYVDSLLGRLFDFLKVQDLYDPALICVVSDHGEEFYEHAGWAHGHQLYREITKVPMLIKWPQGRHAGTRIGAPVELVDLRKTLLHALGYEISGADQGDSLLPLVLQSGHRDLSAAAYGEQTPKWLSVRTRQWAYIERHEADHSEPQLFAADDPGEKVNLAGQRPEVVTGLKTRLHAWIEGVRADSLETEQLPLDLDKLEMLRDLGYLGGN